MHNSPSLEGRVFRVVRNSENGESSSDTLFEYHQQDTLVWATYSGGGVRFGQLIAVQHPDGALDARYQHVNRDGSVRTGICRSVVEWLDDGRLRLHETWQWTSDDRSSGQSVAEEVWR